MQKSMKGSETKRERKTKDAQTGGTNTETRIDK